MSAWTDYATLLLPALQPAAAGSGAPEWVLLAMAAHESSVPPVSDSSLVEQLNPWGIGCDGSPGSCAVYASLAAAGQALPGLLPANALAVAGDPSAFMAQLEADDWSGNPTGNYASSVLDYWGPLAQAALAAIGAGGGGGGGEGGGVVAQETRPGGPPWVGVLGGLALVVGGVVVARHARR